MASERIVHSRYSYPLAIIITVILISSGYFFAISRYTGAAALFIAGLLTFQWLLWLQGHTNRTVAYFFKALGNSDTAHQFPVEIANTSMSQLHESMNTVIRHFQAIKMQNEYNENYYKAIIRHSNSGLLVLNSDNKVELINQAAALYAGISADSLNPNQLKIKNPAFYDAICSLKPGYDVTYKQISGNEYQLLTFRASMISKEGRNLKLISIQDIRHEMESKELESYRKLISVLTHEIMNQVSPLASVSKSLLSYFSPDDKEMKVSEIDENLWNNTRKGLQLIGEHSNGLMNFISNYRKISKIPHPVIMPFDAGEWMEQWQIVYADKMRDLGIQFRISREARLPAVSGDKNLLNQVIINLLNNAIDAVLEISENREIILDCSMHQSNRIRVRISNNGPSIPAEIQDKIFVPFFTTKKHGSGIGLSICQEIMKLHRGSLTVLSSEGKTSFVAEI